MKNKLQFLLFCLLWAGSSFSQDNTITSATPSGFANVKDAAQMADEIVKAAGLKRNFLIAEAEVPNAVAVFHQGKRYILYNPRFVDLLTRATGTKWAAVSVLAHEIGHHLYPNSVNKGKIALATELEADEFSGFVLEKMGATLPEAQAAMSVLASSRASRTHPARADRISSIAKGWTQAGGISESNESQSTEEKFPSRLIAAAVEFNAGSKATYYITTRMNVIKVIEDEITIIARIRASDDPDFSFIIYDDTGYRLYVTNDGLINTVNGKNVGRMITK